MIVEILRVKVPSGDPQFGVIRVNGHLCCLSLERPWLINLPNVSCIPTGNYVCLKVTNRETLGGMHIDVSYEVQNVPNRKGILFHTGNTVRDSHGCIMPGLSLDFNNAEPALLSSKDGFKRFLMFTQDVDRFDLLVREI